MKIGRRDKSSGKPRPWPFVAMMPALAIGLVSQTAAQAPGPVPASPPSLTVEQRRVRATVTLVETRYGDLFWENDRTAHRIYGHPLEMAEPPSGSGIDAWAKSVRWPFAIRQLGLGNYHENHGEGLDFYDVGGSRGAGGLGVWYDNKLWVSRNYREHKILKTGGEVASFEVRYAPWPVDVVRKVWESRRFALPLGTNFTQMVSTISSDKPGLLTVGIGISKVATRGPGKLLVDRERGLMSVWSESPSKLGAMGIAILVDPASIVEFKQDLDNYLVLVRVRPGKPFVYYSGAAWSGGLDFHTQQEWENYVRAQRPRFDAATALALVKSGNAR